MSTLHTSSRRRIAALLAFLLLPVPWPISKALLATPRPGGPLAIGGSSFGISGVPLTWDSAAMPIRYRVDPGPLAKSPSGTVVIGNTAGIARVNSMFAVWASVATADVSATNEGPLLPSGAYAGGPVESGDILGNFNALSQSCVNGTQSPIIFDPNGNLVSALGLSTSIIGFTSLCRENALTGHYESAEIVLQGRFQDGVNNASNFELTANEFNQAITHEIGHFLGLDHSQINIDVLTQQPLSCKAAEVAALPIMFPVLFCQDRVTSGLPPLSPDDTAWISRLYPVTAPAAGKTLTSSAYGTISGTVYFSDGVTAVQGVNVIARSTTNPLGVAFSTVSGYLFTESLGQSVSCLLGVSQCNSAGSSFGTRDTRFVGTFDIPVAPGTYTVQAESVYLSFVGGSSVGPLHVPIAMPGSAPPSVPPVTVAAGGSAVVNIVLVGTAPRFDAFETADVITHDPLWLWHRRDNLISEAVA